MSADLDRQQQLLTGEAIPAHLTTNPEVRESEGYEVDVDKGELYCEDCHLRVTRNTNNHNEYGHARDCPHHQTYGGVE